MYSKFYGFKKEPFHITPDPEFLFLSPSHKQALGSIIYGVTKRKGFVVITGEVGVGKTTILRSYLERVDNPKVKIIYIFNANITFKDLLRTISKELGLDAKTDDRVGMLNDLYRELLEEYRQGNTVLLIVDETQNMPIETLENLRMLSNLETSKDKLLQIVLIGQTEFEKMLNLYELRQLKQRIALRFTIIPFTKEESFDYIRHRLAKVGCIGDTRVFTRGALKRIVREAKGIPRNLNILCDNALITGFGYKIKPVNIKIVKEVIVDLKGKARPSLLKWVLAPTVLLLFIIGLFLIYPYRGLLLSKFENPIVSRLPEQNPVREEMKPSSENPNLSQNAQAAPPEKEVEISTEGKIPAEEKIPPEEKIPAITPSPTIRIVKKGDNLFRLTVKVYGYADDKLVERVRRTNPRIKDSDKILVGDEIVFPEIKKSEWVNE
ncbi:MAG: AAA family ATPase [Deltaproteobacteria bacterium]